MADITEGNTTTPRCQALLGRPQYTFPLSFTLPSPRQDVPARPSAPQRGSAFSPRERESPVAAPAAHRADAQKGVPLPPPPLAGPAAGMGPRRGPSALGRPRRWLRGGSRRTRAAASTGGVGYLPQGSGNGGQLGHLYSNPRRDISTGSNRAHRPTGFPARRCCRRRWAGELAVLKIWVHGEPRLEAYCSPDPGVRSLDARKNNFCTTLLFLSLTRKDHSLGK